MSKDFAEFMNKLGITWNCERDVNYIDVTTFGSPTKKFLEGTTYTITVHGPLGDFTVIDGELEMAEGKVIKHLLTGGWL